MRTWITGVMALAISCPLQVAADDISSAASGLCEKVRSCAMEQVANENLTPELRQMMEPMLDTMCDTMQEKVQQVPVGHPLYQPAIACIRSMEALSCDAMQSPEGMQTPECDAYEKLAKEHGGLE